jgi:hypothetical protein
MRHATTRSSKENVMLNLRLVTTATTLFTTLSFLLCVAVGLIFPQSPLHMGRMLELLLPGFEWITTGAFILGLVESILWGAYLGGGFTLVYNALHRRMVATQTP